MIEGLVRHSTDMALNRTYVDSHGQIEVGFAFCYLLGYDLLPRLKWIHSQWLYLPESGEGSAYPNLQPILTKPIRWELIEQQYDQMIRYATAIRVGTAEIEAILRRFTPNVQHPTYQALLEWGRVLRCSSTSWLIVTRFLRKRKAQLPAHARVWSLPGIRP